MTTQLSQKDIRAKEIYSNIIIQMGGHRALTLMVGASYMTYKWVDSEGNRNADGENLCFAFRFKGSQRLNYCEVIYGLDDFYTVKFGQIRAKGYVERVSFSQVTCDMLKDLFHAHTGLTLNIPVTRRKHAVIER